MKRYLTAAGAFVLVLMPEVAFAEVSDKVASVPQHWALAVPLAVVFFIAARWRWWLALPLAVPVVALSWAGLELPTEPIIGPALLREQGWGYFVSLWSSDLFMAACLIAGAVVGRRRRRGIVASLPNPALQADGASPRR